MTSESYSTLLRQTRILTAANLKTRYRNTWTGYLWVLMNPILIFGAQSYAFHYILKIHLEKYLLFLALGLLPWIFLTSSTEMAVGTLVYNGRFLKSLKVNPLVFVFSQIIDNFINYLSAFILILLPICLFYNGDFNTIWWTALPLLSLVIFVASFAFLCAQIQVFFRDLRFILSFIFQLSFYMTPIFYPPSLIPDVFLELQKFNIFAYLLAPFQMLAHEFTIEDYLFKNLSTFLISICFLGMALSLWKWKKNEIYFNI